MRLSSLAMALSSGTRLGHYEIQSVLGSGGMGVVYLARDMHLGRLIALKVLSANLDPQQQHRLEREARTASSLNHPNILTVYEIGESEHGRFIATEYIEGTTLRRLMKQQALSPADSLKITEHICSALTKAHESGVVHRDIKPENIMIRKDGYLKVLDFGLAKFTRTEIPSRDTPTLANTEPFTALGTVLYMSPEQARASEVGPQTDIWSTGIVLYEMLSGRVPFDGKTDVDAIVSMLTTDMAPVAAFEDAVLNARLNHILSRALAKDLTERYPSMNDFLRDLQDLQAEFQNSGELRFAEQAVKLAAPMQFVRELDTPTSEILSFASAGVKISRPNNLPGEVTPFFGRESELEVVTGMMDSSDIRMITLTGPGGTGKTRLGLEVCRRLLGKFPDGVFFVPLESVPDATSVMTAIARALNIREAGAISILESVQEILREKQILLFLDNFEQVIRAAPAVGGLLRATTALKLLVSSREALRIQGEQEFFVPPLSFPDPSFPVSIERLEDYPSVKLFVNRTRASRPDFVITEDNAPILAQICSRLEGLPLAIELAASRMRIFSPQVLLQRLEKRLPFLTGGAHDLPQRQQTMKKAIEWGYNLLSEDERRFFSQISVFAGGFTLETARRVIAEPEERLLELIESLIDKSFLKRDSKAETETRYAMLDILREFGLEQLEQRGEKEDLLEKHAACFLMLARSPGDEDARRTEEWLVRLETEHDNLRAAMEWMLQSGRGETALTMASSLWWFWYLHGHYTEGRKWLHAALASGGSASSVEWGRARVGAGALAFLQCEYERADELLNSSLELSRAVGDRKTAAQALQFLGSVARERGDYEQAVLRHRDSLDLWTQLADNRGIARSLNYIGFAQWLQGNFEKAKVVCEQSLLLFRELQDQEGIAWALLNLAAVAHYQGEIKQSDELCRLSVASSRAVDYKEGLAWALNILGINALSNKQTESAETLLKRSLELHWSLGDRWRMASVLEALADAACFVEDYGRAATLLAAAENLRKSTGTPIPPSEQTDRDRTLMSLRAALDLSTFETHWMRGLDLRFDRAVTYALNRQALTDGA